MPPVSTLHPEKLTTTRLLYAAFFISGASALIFEVLWFHQAGLAFGNSVWASSLVLAGFMSGLALGNALAAYGGDRVRAPLRFYATIELLIALTGVGLVYLLPVVGSVLARLLSPWIDQPWVINPIRLLVIFLLLVIPSTAMGMTLPLLTQVLVDHDRLFASTLGKLYGWNTLGAVLGVVISEICLIEWLGIRGTAIVAGVFNIAAASISIGLSGALPPVFVGRKATSSNGIRWTSASQWLIAAFLAGFCLLALEVIWFRFLLLYVMTTTVAFALILAIVLAAIAAGGHAGSFWLARRPNDFRSGDMVAFLAGALCVASYSLFSWVIRSYGFAPIQQPLAILWIGTPLMVPVSLMSGVFFVFNGAALRHDMTSDMQTSGALTLANTLGAALGSLVAGFFLLPTFGMERSFLILATVYGVLGLWLLFKRRTVRKSSIVAAGLFFAAVLLFPSGLMKQQHFWAPVKRLNLIKSPVITAIREGLTETILLIKINWFEKTVGHLMITNSFSMAGTGFSSRRYMKLYVYWPVAVHPGLKSALLISYGVGNTAKALTDTRSLASIDIVDISRDILEMSKVIYPNPADRPLQDPRVRIHIEDGRYFLQSTRQRFDLITAEPPPPTTAGVVNLYTREYFELIFGRLAEGGIVTYWLPMHAVSDESAKSIVKSFCDVFSDCSLWTGLGPQLMMVGTRHATGPVSEDRFSRQWQDPAVRGEMADLGFERPEQLGALFIGDADYLHDFLRDTDPLVDDFPKRISTAKSAEGFRHLSLAWTDTDAARERFRRSSFIRRLWPEKMRIETFPYFKIQDSLNVFLNNPQASLDVTIPHLHRILTQTRLRTPVAWFLGSTADILNLLKRAGLGEWNSAEQEYLRGIQAFSERNYAAAAEHLAKGEDRPDRRQEIFRYRIYALCMAGQIDLAQRLAHKRLLESFHGKIINPGSSIQLSPFWQWIKKTFGVEPLEG